MKYKVPIEMPMKDDSSRPTTGRRRPSAVQPKAAAVRLSPAAAGKIRDKANKILDY